MKKRYGDTNTHLTLTDKALAYYSGADPISIYESETESGEYRYTLKLFGDPESEPMTEAALNACLEGLADADAAVLDEEE